MFEAPEKLLLGLLTGVVFGFLLQKGQVSKFPVIVGQFLLRDWTVVKVMATAVAVGSVGVYALISFGYAELHVKPLLLSGVLVGGVLFAVGMVVFGYCPGTSVAACGEGHRDAMVGVLGMFFGAGLFVAAFPYLQPLVKALGDAGKLTLPTATGTSPWLWVGGMVLAVLAIFGLVEGRRRHGKRRAGNEPSDIPRTPVAAGR